MLAPTLVRRRSQEQAAELARELLARVGLAEKFDATPDQLSGAPRTPELKQFLSSLHD